jgi:HD-like signal output (HDOD) protein
MQQEAHHARETRLAVQKLNELPAMSLAAQQFLAAVADANVEIGHFAHIIERDPALLARVVGVANAAYFSYAEPVTTAEEAIFRVLGLQTTKSIVLGIILSGPFDTSRCRGFHINDFWLECIFTATLAQHLAPLASKSHQIQATEAYLAGLLHNIGLLAMAHLDPDGMEQVFSDCQQCRTPDELQRLERQQLAVTHSEVGAWLARKWHLPKVVVDVTAHHLESDYRGSDWPLVTLVGFCARWAAAAVHYGTYEDYPPLSELAALGIDAPAAGKVVGKVARKLDELRKLVQEFANG